MTRFKSNRQRKAVMMKLCRGDIVMSPVLSIPGTFKGKTKKGFRMDIVRKDKKGKLKTIMLFTRSKPVKVMNGINDR